METDQVQGYPPDWVLEVLRAVAAPLDPADIKIRRDKDKDLRYIDARVVYNRLNTVAFGLWSSYVQSVEQGESDQKGVRRYVAVGSLTICGITHSDCGMSDSDTYFDPAKAAVSDMIKRCAVQFGLGIELYNDDDQRPVGGGGDAGVGPEERKNRAPAGGQQAKGKPQDETPAQSYDRRVNALKPATVKAAIKRPFAPAQLVKQILIKCAKNELAGPSTDDQQGKLAGAINALFDNEIAPDEWRHQFLWLVLEKDSVKDTTKAEASVLIDWAEADPENAANEAYLIIKVANQKPSKPIVPGIPALQAMPRRQSAPATGYGEEIPDPNMPNQ